MGATQGQILSQSPIDEVAFVWELTKETIHLLLSWLQGGWVSTAKQNVAF